MPRVRRCRHQGCHAFAMVPNFYCDKHQEEEKEREQRHQSWNEKRTAWKYNHVKRHQNYDIDKRNKFYQSKEWKDLRQVALHRDNFMCQYCKVQGRVRTGNTVDHLIPIEADMTKIRDINNLVTSCPQCHKLKTNWEHEYYGTGKNHALTGAVELTDITLVVKLMSSRNQYKAF